MIFEQRVIHVAAAYAESNGYRSDDRVAVGLVLAGMAIMASCSPAVQADMLRQYLAAHPGASAAIAGWTEFLSATKL